MRLHFVESLISLSEARDDTFLVVGDLGFGVVEKFADKFPSRFLNAGVAEQNMLGMAAGIASTEKLVFVYSIANFPSLRALEQIRNDIAYHDLAVVVVSVGAGLGYGTLGYSHHAVEDVSVLRSIPGMTVYSPADEIEVQACMQDIALHRRPAYLRLGKGGEPSLHLDPLLTSVTPIRLSGLSSSSVVLSHGAIGHQVAQALNSVRRTLGVDISHYSVPRLGPGDLEGVGIHKAQRVLTVEEHTRRGGFGSYVLEHLADAGQQGATKVVGLREAHTKEVGDRDYLLELNGLDPNGLAQQIEAHFGLYGD